MDCQERDLPSLPALIRKQAGNYMKAKFKKHTSIFGCRRLRLAVSTVRASRHPNSSELPESHRRQRRIPAHSGFKLRYRLRAGDDGLTARAVLRVAELTDRSPFLEGLSGVTLSNNRADRNADLGFDVEGVTDGGGQVAKFNVNPEQCRGVACRPRISDQPQSLSIPSLTALQNARVKAKLAPLQLKHKK
jgi:hypothetical protein